MANNKILVEIQVTDGGTAKIVQKGIESVGKATEGTTKKTREASKAQDELNYKLNQGATGVSSAARSFSKLNQAIGSGPNGLVGAYATLAANAFAVSAAFNAFKNAAQVEQLLKGIEAQGARTGHTLTLLTQQVRELSGASLSSADAMRSVAQASTAGIKSDDIRRLTEVATASAKALGRDVPDSMNRLIMAVTKAEPELVDELGLTIKLNEAMDMYARQAGKATSSLTRLEKQQALVNAWASQGEAKFGALSKSVDPNPYDQLAASFEDLKNTLLTFINDSGLLAFVGFLATDKLALTTAIIFFLNTVKGQLLPVLTEAGKRARELAEKRVAGLNKEKTELDAVKKSLGDNQAANDKLFSSLSKKDPSKAYKEWADAEKKGIATTEQHARAVDSLTDSQKRYENLASKAENAKDSVKADKYLNLATTREQDIRDLKNYYDQKTTLADAATKLESQEVSLLNQIKLEESIVTSQVARADAIEALAKGNLALAIDKVALSSAAYKEQLVAQIVLEAQEAGVADLAAVAENAHASALIKLRAAGFGAATGIKAVGSAILTFLPYIGLALLAWDALSWAWETFKPDAWKKQEQAWDDLTVVIESTNQKLEAYNSIVDAQGDITQKSISALENKTNTLSEAIGAYDTYTKAIQESSDNQISSTEDATRAVKYLAVSAIPMIGPELALATAAWDMWADSTNKELGIPLNSLTHEIFGITPASSDAEKAMASMMATMERSLPNTTKDFYELNDNLKGLGEEARKAKIDEFLGKIRPVMEQAKQAVDELKDSLTEVSTAWGDLIRSIGGTTTPFDRLTASVDKTLGSFNKFKLNMNNGIINEKDAKEMVAQVDQAVANLPSAILGGTGLQTRDTIQQTDNALVSLREKQKGLAEDSQAYKNIQESITSLEKDKIRLAAQLGEEAKKNLATLQTNLHTSQLDTIAAQSALTLAQARLGVIQRQGKISVEDVNKEIDAKNAVVAAQIRQLNINRAYLVMEVDKKKLELDAATRRAQELKDLADRNQSELDYLEIRLKVYKMWLQMGVQTSKTVSDIAETDRQLAMIGEGGSTRQNLQSQAEAARDAVTQAKNAYDLAVASLGNLDAQIAAAGLQAVTNVERRYEVAKQLITIAQEDWALTKRETDAGLEKYKLERQLLDIQNKGLGATTREFEVLKEEYRLRRLDEAKQYEFQKADLTAERDKAVGQGRTAAAQILNDRIASLKRARDIEVANSQTQEELEILNKIGLTTDVQRYELLQKSLEVSQKEADLRQSTLDKEQELTALRLRNAQGGGELGPGVQKALAYRQAEEQLKLAREQLQLRKQGIIAEYSLLEAQRALLEDQLKAAQAQAKTLASTTTNEATRTAANEAYNTLSNAIDNLSKVSYTALRENALRVADLDVQVLEERAKLAYNEIIRGFLDDVLGKNNPAWKLGQAVEDTALIIQQLKAGKSIKEATTQLDPSTKATVSSIDATTTAVNSTTQAVDRLHDTIRTQGSTNSDTSNPNVEEAASIATSLTRLPAFRSAFGMTSGFGTRERPIRGASRQHGGVDYAYPEGTSLTAQLPGVVKFSGTMGGFGNVVDVYVGELENGTKIFRRFAHLMDTVVTTGEKVGADTILGHTGNTGTSTGPHLHQGTYMEDSRGRTTAMSPNWQPMMRGYNDGASNDNEIVVTARKNMESIATAWSDSVKMARDEVAAGGEEIKLSFIESLASVSPIMAQMNEQLRTLGPQGELVASINEGMMTISTSIATIVESLGSGFSEGYTKYMEDATNKLMETGDLSTETLSQLQSQGEYAASKLAVAFSAAAAAIGAVNQILSAASQAKIANIDKEIAAEEKRDGKSAESLAKLDALEKKKDAMAKKQFNVNKKLMMANAVISTAAGVASALAAPFPMNLILPALIGAMGAAQLAVIAGTQYESSYSPKAASAAPSSIAIGSRSSAVDLAKGPNPSAGGEIGYLRGTSGTGTSAADYRTIGSAYGGELMRGYGNRGFVVGEKGPEVITPDTPITVTPANEVQGGQPLNATFNIQALDASGVQDILVSQKGNIIKMLRDAANASGQRFMEDVNVNVYTRPNVGKL